MQVIRIISELSSYSPDFCTMQIGWEILSGGMKAVLWTDLFQGLMMYSAVFAVIAKGTIDVGGFSEVWRLADEEMCYSFDPDPTVRHTVWTLAVGGIFTYVSIYAVNQAQVQRLLTVKSLKESQIALFLNWPLTSLLSITASLAGIVVYANLAKCDPILRSEETNIEKADQGSIIGFLVSLCVCFWIGIAAAMRRSHKLPINHRSIDGCPVNGSVIASELSTLNYANGTVYGSLTNSTNFNLDTDDENGYVFPLLRLSYMWYAGFGYITCIVVGFCSSLIWGERSYVNPILLSPIVHFKSSRKYPISEEFKLPVTNGSCMY
ncbi:sodium-dependent multivitamin transporter [Trichonephila clavipes]|nr:sodium-dependent multivitamin transporter [Trichonephila clavipes]